MSEIKARYTPIKYSKKLTGIRFITNFDAWKRCYFCAKYFNSFKKMYWVSDNRNHFDLGGDSLGIYYYSFCNDNCFNLRLLQSNGDLSIYV